MFFFSLTCWAICPSRLIWCELKSFRDIASRSDGSVKKWILKTQQKFLPPEIMMIQHFHVGTIFYPCHHAEGTTHLSYDRL